MPEQGMDSSASCSEKCLSAGPRSLCAAKAYCKLKVMSSVNDIEEAVQRLTPAELSVFRTWFAEFDAAAWDREIEDDVAAGRLDALAEEALEDYRAGRCTER
jgi:hypothetical protein